MRSRRLATSGDGMPEAGKVEAQAPGALAPPSVRFHSGTRKRRTQGIRVRPHPQAHRILPKHRGPVSRPFAPGCAAWGPCPAVVAVVPGPSLSSADRTLRCSLRACVHAACPERLFREDGSFEGAGWRRSVWVPCGSPAGVCP